MKEIKEYFKANRGEIVTALKRLASIPSVQGKPAGGAPFGTSCRDVLLETQKLYREHGFAAGLSEDGSYLLAHGGNGEKCIGLFAHADVVPPGEGWMITPPFIPLERDGFLFGRGVSDNKSGVTASLFAAKAIRELGLPLKSGLLMFTGSNEESGMADIRAFVRGHEMPDISLVPDCAFPVYRGEKGILRFRAVSGEKLGSVLSFEGGEAFNVVPGSASAELVPDPELCRRLSAAVGDRVSLDTECGPKLSAVGIPKHAASPEGSVNAALLIINVLCGCEALPESDRKLLGFAGRLLGDDYGKGFGIESDDPDFGRLTCANGMVRMTGGKLCLSFDARYGVTTDGAELEAKISRLLDLNNWKYEPVQRSGGFIIGKDNRILQTILETYSGHTGEKDPESRLSSGGTYARHLKNAFSVGTSLGEHPCPCELPPGHGGGHQADEMISIDGLLEAAELLVLMILRLDEASAG